MKTWIKNNLKGDPVIWSIVIFLFLVSLLAVYSSTRTLAYAQKDGNTEYFLLKHLALSIFGLFLMFVTHQVNYRHYSRFAQILVWISVPLLIYTLIGGTSINGAKRWLTIPIIGQTFQTSDFAKLALMLYLARALTIRQKNIKDFKKGFLPLIAWIIAICILIFPSNFSTAFILFVTSLIVIFIGRARVRHIGLGVSVGTVLVLLYVLIAPFFYEANRIQTWENRWDNFWNGNEQEQYQVNQAKIAIATVGLFGKGPGNSQQSNFLPQAYSDFIYPIIIEEWGSLFAILVLLAYLTLLYRCMLIVSKTPKAFGALLAVGLGFSLVIQAMVNMAVGVNLFPVTGQTLPLVSMGGTSLWFTSIAIGIILSVSKNIEENEIQNLEPNATSS